MDKLGEKKKVKKEKSYGKLATRQVTYQKGGKQVVETYISSNKTTSKNHPKKSVKSAKKNPPQQRHPRLNPYGFGWY